VHSATQPEIYSSTFGAPGRGLGIRFSLDSLPKYDGADRRAPRRDFGSLCGGGRSCFLHTSGSQSPGTSHSCCARRTAAHGGANIPDSIKGVSGGVVSSQGVVATPSKLHGFTRSHEAVAGRRRPAAQYGTFYLDQVEGAVITVPTRGIIIGALTLSKGRAGQRPPGRTQPQPCGRGCPGILGKGARAPPKHQWTRPRSRLRCGCTADTNGHPVLDGCPLGRSGLRRTGGSPSRGILATQVPATPAGKIRRNIKPVGVPAGVRYRHHGGRWKHHCDGNILSCGLVWTCPDLAHEPHPEISLFLGRTLCAVHSELRQCLPTARCGGPPPCSEAGAWGNPPEVHLPLHQGTRYDTSYF
jgi:hypothetical protein